MDSGIEILTPLHKSYPENLKEIKDSPKILYFKGRILAKDSRAIAVVGSRKVSSYGQKITKFFVKALVQKGITIISGMAKGVDTVAHRSALEAGGRTIAVLGSGLDIIYPSENKRLAHEITERGALVSEFPLGTKPLAKNFLERNRLISGLSKGVLVIEGAKRSGTLSTASHAASQGREVFAVPGPIDSILSEAPNFLISQGATLATKPQDILDIII